jgi:predicted metalloprotease
MQWTPGGTSSDIEDRRGEGGSGFGGGGFGGFGGFGGARLGLGGILLLLVLGWLTRGSFFQTASGPATDRAPATSEADRSPTEQREVEFVSFVLDDVQHTWDQLLPQQTGRQYQHSKLVLFRDYTESGCGTAESATGPFYCPGDEKVYVDLGFFQELADRFGAPGEFAQAYVLAHEIGHHVQDLLGIRSRGSTVPIELQADCLAGVWGNTTEQRKIVDQSDVSAGLNAAAAVGDDRLQRMARGRVSPESFTHGSSAQRVEAFRRGLDSGRVSACNIEER